MWCSVAATWPSGYSILRFLCFSLHCFLQIAHGFAASSLSVLFVKAVKGKTSIRVEPIHRHSLHCTAQVMPVNAECHGQAEAKPEAVTTIPVFEQRAQHCWCLEESRAPRSFHLCDVLAREEQVMCTSDPAGAFLDCLSYGVTTNNYMKELQAAYALLSQHNSQCIH